MPNQQKKKTHTQKWVTFKRMVCHKTVSLCLFANIGLKPCVLFAARKFRFQINGRWWINKAVEFVMILSVHFEYMSLILIYQRPKSEPRSITRPWVISSSQSLAFLVGEPGSILETSVLNFCGRTVSETATWGILYFPVIIITVFIFLSNGFRTVGPLQTTVRKAYSDPRHGN